VAILAAAAVVAAVLLSGGERIKPADPSAMAYALPDKPSIAVLPFREISGESAPSGLTQGMAEDITTALSAMPDIFVIAPAAARPFADQTEAPGRIAEALGVRWVLDGSIQRVGERVRISVQLSDALRGAQVWADRYDRAIEDVFALQDEITLKVLATLEVTMARGEAPQRAPTHGTRNLEAWLAASEGLGALRRLTRGENARARVLYARAAELDPNYAGALEGLAWTHYIDARFNWSADPVSSLATAATLVEKTIELDPTRGRAYSLRGSIVLTRGDHARAVEFGERAIQLSPSDSEAMALLANTLTYAGDLERSLVVMEKAMRLSPSFPDWYAWNLARIYRMLGRAKEALPLLDAHLKPENEALAPRLELVMALVDLNDLGRAKREAAAVRAVEPHFSAARWTATQPYADRSVADAELALLERAGLPR
jgi:TolB-like protein/Flp pilus assembly protein TadD